MKRYLKLLVAITAFASMLSLSSITAFATVYYFDGTQYYEVEEGVDDYYYEDSFNAPAPVLSILSADDRSVTLSWTAVEGAEEYRIYVYEGSSYYSEYTMLNDTTYTLDYLNSDTYYSFAVTAVSKYGNESPNLSNRVSYHTYFEGVSDFKSTAKDNGYVLSWSKLSNVNGYIIYKYNPSSKQYEEFKDINDKNKTSLKFKSKSGQAFAYKIKAYKDIDSVRYFSEESNAVAAGAKLKAPTVKSVYSSKAGVLNVKWQGNQRNASGYEIVYTSFDNFDYYRTYQVKGKSAKSKAIKVREGIPYKVKVRSYIEVDGKMLYSPSSSSLSCYTKSTYSKNIKGMLNKLKLKPKKTGCEKLDKIAQRIVDDTKKSIKKSGKKATTYEMVRGFYAYIAQEKFSTYGIKGETNTNAFYQSAALRVLETKQGSCVDYNSLFKVLCEYYGVKCDLYSGTVSAQGGGRTIHTWTLIKLGGDYYIFDPRLQRYTSNNKGFTYFALPHSKSSHYANMYRYYDAQSTSPYN